MIHIYYIEMILFTECGRSEDHHDAFDSNEQNHSSENGPYIAATVVLHVYMRRFVTAATRLLSPYKR